MTPSLLHSIVVAALLAAACASDPASSDGNGGGAGEPSTGAGSSNGGKGGVPEAECPAASNPPSAKREVEVGFVSAQLVDEQGEPTSSGLVQICGKNVCVNAHVGDDGNLAEDVAQLLDDPACKFGDGLTWGKLAIQLDKGDTELGTLTTARLPDFADGVPFTPGEAISSGGVTLSLSADAHVEIDTLTYEDESQRGFRAVELSEPALTQLKQDFVAGFALSPVDTRICPSPALSLQNTRDLAPGSALELYVLGVDVSEALTSYGEWKKVGEGQVSDDGATLDFPDGLPLLTAIGVREKG